MKKLSAYLIPQTILPNLKYPKKTDKFRKIETRIMLVFWYFYSCIRQRAVPWHFFQLNSKDFNDAKGIFSKLEMDIHIPEKWRLKQYYYDREHVPEIFPVFLKPEWGQNSNGIFRVQNKSEYSKVDQHVRHRAIPYIVQHAAAGKEEFEIYYLRSPEKIEECGVFSITWVKKRSAVLRGMFQIVEINLFLPMPLVLLATNVEEKKKKKLIRQITMVMAGLIKLLPHNETGKSIFFRKIQAHYRSVR